VTRGTAADVKAAVRAAWGGGVRWDAPMAPLTTLGVGGPALALVEPASISEIAALARSLREAGIPWLVMGGGSNILVADQGVAGVVVRLGARLAAINEIDGGRDDALLRVEAGCPLARLLGAALERGLCGLEFCAGIPGSVGGAVMMNAGAWGSDMSGVVEAVEIIAADGEMTVRRCRKSDFSYRCWNGPAGALVVAAHIRLRRGNADAAARRCRELAAKRRDKQPRLPSCGSFFKNPPEMAAGRLIETAGLKGLRMGRAQVSEKHANFLVNLGGASAMDFFRLGERVRREVLACHGVRLDPEVRFIGRWPRPFGEGDGP